MPVPHKIIVSKAFFLADSTQPPSAAVGTNCALFDAGETSTETKSSEIFNAIIDLDSTPQSNFHSTNLLNHEVRKRKNQLPLVPYSSGSNSDEADSLELTDPNQPNLHQVSKHCSPPALTASPSVESHKATISLKYSKNLRETEKMDQVIIKQENIEVRRPRLLSSKMRPVDENANRPIESMENLSDTVKDVRRRAEEKRRRMLETHGCQVTMDIGAKKQTLNVFQTDFIVHESRPTPKLRINTSEPASSKARFLPPPPTNSPEKNPPKLATKVNLHKTLPVENLPKPPSMSVGCCPEISWPSRSRNFRSPIIINMAEILPGSVFDSHCHLDFCSKNLSREGNRDIVTLEAMLAMDGEGMKVYDSESKKGKFGGCIANFCHPSSWNFRNVSEAVRQAETDKGVYISIGCHPHFADRLSSDWRMQLEQLVVGKGRLGNLVALGEMGLDYSGKNSVDRELQKKVFKAQLEIALKYALPVVLHIREAEEDGYQVLRSAGVPPDYPLHRHCFNGDLDAAKRWLDTYPGSMIGLTALVTFPDASHIHEVAKWISLDRLLLETDAPYFLPKGIDRSEYSMNFSLPGHVIYTAAEIATLRGDNIKNILTANARNVTKIYGVGKDGIVKNSAQSGEKGVNRSGDNGYRRNSDRTRRVADLGRKICPPFPLRARKSTDLTNKETDCPQKKKNSSHNSSVVNFVSEDRVLDESGSFLGDSTNTSNSSNSSHVIQSSKAKFSN